MHPSGLISLDHFHYVKLRLLGRSGPPGVLQGIMLDVPERIAVHLTSGMARVWVRGCSAFGILMGFPFLNKQVRFSLHIQMQHNDPIS